MTSDDPTDKQINEYFDKAVPAEIATIFDKICQLLLVALQRGEIYSDYDHDPDQNTDEVDFEEDVE